MPLLRSEQDHRHGARAHVGLYLLAQLDSRQMRHHHVGKDQIRQAALDRLQRRLSVGDTTTW